MTEHVILVTPDDVPVGVHGKQGAHVDGLLHRAFSVFVVDSSGRLLLQQRAWTKYHSAGLWSNTCCSHPRPGESTAAAAQRRLFEEMGFNCPIETAFSFVYRADVGGGLIEHEYDHVFIGRFDGDPAPDAAEVADWRWITPRELEREMRERPDRFTYWFRVAYAELRSRDLS
ncbi:MAG: isopentenyl-diphosphate Delta-isomerase [Gemmatimonadetes bacterium]|nr:isopentenyl-diphosphate Delta-isomerase [Gemmatimonadota bacterium]